VTALTKRITDTIRTVLALDSEWMKNPAGRDDPRSTPWMPSPMFDFIALVAEALPDSEGDRFLEIGSGAGTRMLLAKEIFGLSVHGIDRVPEYVQQARELGLSAQVQDALTYEDYGNFDIIWFNRPFRDRDLQSRLEEKVWAGMKPGAVVICANLENPPPSTFWLVLDDMEVRRGIWSKLP
jgi:SAM-dependent methyltransferase